MKLISIHDFEPSSLILKAPIQIGSCYLSEVLYLTPQSRLVKPIFKTPRLRIKYGAKRFNTSTSYGYCLSMANKDIDPEIAEFYTFVKQFDKTVIAKFTESYKSWSVRPTKCMKYRTAMKRQSINDDFYFQVKLIDDIKPDSDTRDLATIIYNTDRNTATPEDIVYGKYADQFICPAYLYYDENGIHSVWQAHQILLSNVEKIFLEHCILDHIYPPKVPTPPPVHQPMFFNLPPPPPPPTYERRERDEPPVAPRMVLQINPCDLKSAIQNLRKAQTKEN